MLPLKGVDTDDPVWVVILENKLTQIGENRAFEIIISIHLGSTGFLFLLFLS